jgi:hypothetical protein
MVVQILVLTAIAVLLLRPWWLVTRRRCALCRSATPRRSDHCRFCGAPAGVSAPARAPRSSDGRSVDELGEPRRRDEDVAVNEQLRYLGPVDPASVES